MSILHIETKKTAMVDGVEYTADIRKDVVFNFSEANFTLKMWEAAHDAEIELIPDSMDFLHEVTEFFPLSEYDIKIKQSIYRHAKPYIAPDINIQNKQTGEKVWFPGGVILSDEDYRYLRDIFMSTAPANKYEWRTVENCLRAGIERYLDNERNRDLFTHDAWHFLSRMVSARYREFKMDGYVGFDYELMKQMQKTVLEEALRSVYEGVD